MTTNGAIEIAWYAGLIPAISAAIAFVIIRFALPESVARRYALGGSLSIGIFLGYFLLPSTQTLLPLQFYEWVAHLGIGAAIVAGLMIADGVWRGERIVATMFASFLAAWFIVPTWPDQVPPQHFHVVLVGLGMFLLGRFLEFLPARLAGRAFPLWLMLAAGTVAMLKLAEVGETLGRLAALPAGALAGCAFASLVSRRESDLRSVALPYTVTVGAYAFTGYIYPTAPIYLLLVVPFAPLTLWLCAVGPLKHLDGVKAIVAQGLCVLVPLAIISVVVLIGGSGGSDPW